MPSTHSKSQPGRESRIVGALLALHAGDSLGATCEFKSHGQIATKYPNGLRDIVGGGPFSWAPGHATDDTDMTRAVLLAYRDYTPGADIGKLAGGYFLKWYRGDWPGRNPGTMPVDIGSATTEGLDRYEDSLDPDYAGAGEGSAGNGSLMRCLPTGLFRRNPDTIIYDSIRISKITHDDFRCTSACAIYNTIVSELINGSSPEEAVSAGEKLAEKLEDGKRGDIYQAMKLGRTLDVETMADRGPPSDLKFKCNGYVLESLTLGVSAVLDPRDLEDVLVDVVRIGKDTDSNAAIAGGLLGARDGEEAIPTRWKEKLQFADEFRHIAAGLLRDEN